MSDLDRLTEIAAKAERLRALHAGPRMLVLPNAWDAASAKVFEAAGFAAIATTSGGVSAALGFQDHELAPVDEMAAAANRIAGAVTVPVSVDFEAGYQLTPGEIVERLLVIGAAGMNLEDSDHHSHAALIPMEVQAERLAAVKAAARAAGVDFFLNARVDVFLHKLGSAEEQLAEGLRRARLYQEAGADCIYPIMLADEAMISELVEAVGPINVNLRRGGPLSLERVTALGVRRVTYASSLFRETMGALEGIARELQAESTGGPK
ncbi:MAG: isocitrate lyase/phosphoenolpyruvate mutase family protein [Chloroflexi bacterium]|nr:isocitrate lyase/phosphoenolpyruvate mutase family protein [Chloroflexota bacterium]